MIRSRLCLIGMFFCAVSAMFLPTACFMLGPDYHPPKESSPAKWNSQLSDGLTSGTMDSKSLAKWWERFDDPILTSLIEQAIQNNLDLKSATSRVCQALAQRSIARAGLFPTLSSSASVTRTHTESKTKTLGTLTTDNDLYSAGFDASWEVDVFGGVRRSVEASDKEIQVTQASLYDVLVSLAAEVAINYVDARSYQTRLDLAEENLQIQKETLDLAEARFQAGLSDEFSVQQARYSYESTASQVPSLRTGLEGTLNHLAVLLGETPGSLHERLKEHRPIPSTSYSVAVGVPSEALRRRPDIRKAESELAAQTARIGVAVADLYPKFYINGSASRQADSLVDFRKFATDSWKLGPSISWNLFNAGALRSNVKVQTEVKEQDLFAYQSAILSALEEVENKIYSFGQEQLRQESLKSAVAAAQSALQLSQYEYKAGTIDFTDVLNAEQSLVSFQDQLAQSEGARTSDLISLFKALGGGWTPSASVADSANVDAKERIQ